MGIPIKEWYYPDEIKNAISVLEALQILCMYLETKSDNNEKGYGEDYDTLLPELEGSIPDDPSRANLEAFMRRNAAFFGALGNPWECRIDLIYRKFKDDTELVKLFKDILDENVFYDLTTPPVTHM